MTPSRPLLLLAALAVLGVAPACTKDNPARCDSDRDCRGGEACDPATRRCGVPDAGDETPDAPRDTRAADRPVDAPAVVDGSARDAAADARDAAPDATPDRAPDLAPDLAPDGPDSCSANEHCRAPRPLCVANRCVECTVATQCSSPGRPFCVANACQGCAAAGAGACAGRVPGKPVCDAATGHCVECARSADCGDPGKPICVAGECRPCTTDAQCAARSPNPGVCLGHLGGRCAEDRETIYVQRTAACATGRGDGSAASPFCSPQDAVAAVSPTRRVIVMKGPTALDRWVYSLAGPLVTVIGKEDARILPGVEPGIRVSGGEILIRGLRVTQSDSVGIIAENGAVVRIDRCVVEGNRGGGIYVNGAGFEITNTVVAKNEAAPIAPMSSTLFGGVLLSGVLGKPQRFLNNTIVDNRAIGLYCTSGYAAKGLLLSGNGADVVGCQLTSSVVGMDPRFDPARPYRLTRNSPCHDQGDPTEFPEFDIDGDSRPKGRRSDCGADELLE